MHGPQFKKQVGGSVVKVPTYKTFPFLVLFLLLTCPGLFYCNLMSLSLVHSRRSWQVSADPHRHLRAPNCDLACKHTVRPAAGLPCCQPSGPNSGGKFKSETSSSLGPTAPTHHRWVTPGGNCSLCTGTYWAPGWQVGKRLAATNAHRTYATAVPNL